MSVLISSLAENDTPLEPGLYHRLINRNALESSRRTFLAQAAASLGVFYLAGLTPEVLAQSHEHAKVAPRNLDGQPFRFFTPQQAADYAAFSEQIAPTDDTPGAREANVVRFVDFALSEIEPQNKQDFAKALVALNAQARKIAPHAASFSALTLQLVINKDGDLQIELRKNPWRLSNIIVRGTEK